MRLLILGLQIICVLASSPVYAHPIETLRLIETRFQLLKSKDGFEGENKRCDEIWDLERLIDEFTGTYQTALVPSDHFLYHRLEDIRKSIHLMELNIIFEAFKNEKLVSYRDFNSQRRLDADRDIIDKNNELLRIGLILPERLSPFQCQSLYTMSHSATFEQSERTSLLYALVEDPGCQISHRDQLVDSILAYNPFGKALFYITSQKKAETHFLKDERITRDLSGAPYERFVQIQIAAARLRLRHFPVQETYEFLDQFCEARDRMPKPFGQNSSTQELDHSISFFFSKLIEKGSSELFAKAYQTIVECGPKHLIGSLVAHPLLPEELQWKFLSDADQSDPDQIFLMQSLDLFGQNKSISKTLRLAHAEVSLKHLSARSGSNAIAFLRTFARNPYAYPYFFEVREGSPLEFSSYVSNTVFKNSYLKSHFLEGIKQNPKITPFAIQKLIEFEESDTENTDTSKLQKKQETVMLGLVQAIQQNRIREYLQFFKGSESRLGLEGPGQSDAFAGRNDLHSALIFASSLNSSKHFLTPAISDLMNHRDADTTLFDDIISLAYKESNQAADSSMRLGEFLLKQMAAHPSFPSHLHIKLIFILDREFKSEYNQVSVLAQLAKHPHLSNEAFAFLVEKSKTLHSFDDRVRVHFALESRSDYHERKRD